MISMEKEVTVFHANLFSSIKRQILPTVLSMKVIHAHIDVRMISSAIGVNSLSLPVMRKIVDKIFDYFSYIYKFLC